MTLTLGEAQSRAVAPPRKILAWVPALHGLAAAVLAVFAGAATAGTITGGGLPPISESVSEDGVSPDGRLSIFVELAGEPAAKVFTERRNRFVADNRFVMAGSPEQIDAEAERIAARAAFDVAGALRLQQSGIVNALNDQLGVKVLFTMRFVHNGVGALARPDQIARIQALPGVARVSVLATHELNAVSSLDFTGVRTFWGTAAPDNNRRGAQIGVGVIDTGIDHMHTAFGGPGGAAGYATGVTTIAPFPAPPTVPTAVNFPTPKVVWGYDYVGDAYNAGGTTNAALIPVPDPNPIDTGGHGTAVASLIAAFGSNNDGTAYAGPFDRTQPNVAQDLRISPGYAPEAALYNFRVFGTSGTSGVVPVSLDTATAIYLWQSDTSIPWDGAFSATAFNTAGQPVVVNYSVPQPPATPRLRVVNLSLGSNAGDIEEASAIAAQRAADAGLVVVLSAGNAYDSYYITGSPGVATGGISVAASLNDQFPGGAGSAPANPAATPPQPAITDAAIANIGIAASALSPAPLSFPPTDAVYARPAYAGRSEPVPAPCAAPPAGFMATLEDAAGLPINIFECVGGVIQVSANPAANNPYTGRVVLVDRGGGVGFHQKALAVQRAGGIAALIVDNGGGVAGLAAGTGLPVLTIPVVAIEQGVGATFTLDGSLNLSTIPAPGRANVATRPGLQIRFAPSGNVALSDTIAIYSSRGPRRTDDGIKPDISAPAENVTAALANTGNGVRSFGGTSSAAPHTAGAMALLRAINPTWSNYELKALLLNGAANNIFASTGAVLSQPPTDTPWGVSRQGGGRWDLSRYANGGTKVIMFGQDPATTAGGAPRSGMVNVSFGVVDVQGSVTQDRVVTVRNKGNTAESFTIGFVPNTDTPGVAFSFPDGTAISVPAQSERTFRLRMTANAEQMRHAREAALAPSQLIGGAPGTRFPRQYINEESGQITLTPAAGGAVSHRLTVQAFPRRASAVSVPSAPVVLGQSTTLAFTGSGYLTGTNLNFTNPPTFNNNPAVVDIASFAKPLELAWSSSAPAPSATAQQRAADIQHVGVISDAVARPTPFDTATSNNQAAVVVFGIATRGEWDTLQAGVPGTPPGTEFQIEIDTNNDTTAAERLVRQLAFVNTQSGPANSPSNVMLPGVAPGPAFTIVSATGWSLNVLPTAWTNLYNNSVVLIPVSVTNGLAGQAGSLGLTATTSRFNYRVRGVHRGIVVSQTPWLTYDVLQPGVRLSVGQQPVLEPSLSVPFDAAGVSQPVTLQTNATAFAANNSQGILMLYPMNAAGNRAQVVPVALADGVFADGFEPAPAP